MNRRHTTTHAHKQFHLRREAHEAVAFVDTPAMLSPVAHMLAAFTTAGLTRLEPSFFGLTLRRPSAALPVAQPQPAPVRQDEPFQGEPCQDEPFMSPTRISFADTLIAAFLTAGLTRPAPSFFGLTLPTQTAGQPVAPVKRAILPLPNQSQTTLRHAA